MKQLQTPAVTAAQIAHLREHQAEFNEHQVSTTDVDLAEYFHDNAVPEEGGYGAIYINICNDLGIEPKPELITVDLV